MTSLIICKITQDKTVWDSDQGQVQTPCQVASPHLLDSDITVQADGHPPGLNQLVCKQAGTHNRTQISPVLARRMQLSPDPMSTMLPTPSSTRYEVLSLSHTAQQTQLTHI